MEHCTACLTVGGCQGIYFPLVHKALKAFPTICPRSSPTASTTGWALY